MEFQDLVRTRRSVRGYKPDPVPRHIIEEVIATAAGAPSSMNTQPWHVHVLTGEILDEVRRRNMEGMAAGEEPKRDIVTHDGYTVQPGITIPQNAINIAINDSGEVLVTIDGTVTPQNVGQIQLSRFQNEAGLTAIGNNLFLETDASGGATTANPNSTGYGSLLQGYLETSNVNVVEEITNLITAQRAYEMNSKVIETSYQMMATVTNIR